LDAAQADAPVDSGQQDAPAGLVLTTPQGTFPLVAYYSIFLEPLEADGGTDVELVVTLVDPAFTCTGAPPQGVDERSLGFRHGTAPASAIVVPARNGPQLGSTGGGSGMMDLAVIDGRFRGEHDGGAADVRPGGQVSGSVQFDFAGNIEVRGEFA